MAGSAESIAALLVDCLARAGAFVHFRFDENPMMADPPFEPGGERILIGERAVFHRAEFRDEQSVVPAPDTRHASKRMRRGSYSQLWMSSAQNPLGLFLWIGPAFGWLAAL